MTREQAYLKAIAVHYIRNLPNYYLGIKDAVADLSQVVGLGRCHPQCTRMYWDMYLRSRLMPKQPGRDKNILDRTWARRRMGGDDMGWDISGSLEISYGAGWIKIIDLCFLDREYHLFGNLFGVKGASKDKAIAFNRGMPDRPASHTLTEYLLAKQMDKSTCYESYVLQSELSDPLPEGYKTRNWSWIFLFDAMKRFGDHVGDDNVRLVVWFNF